MADETCRKLFPASYDRVVPVYPMQRVDAAVARWHAQRATLDRLELALKQAGDGPRAARLHARAAAANTRLEALHATFLAERQAAMAMPAPCFFLTFNTQQAAAIAARSSLSPQHERLMHVMPAPEPNDVNYPTLCRPSWQSLLRPVLVVPVVWFMILFPIGARKRCS